MNKILIIGLGLIGGSFAKAIKKSLPDVKISGFDVDIDTIELAKNDKIIEDYYSLEDSLEDFDLVVVASPLETYEEIFEQISQNDFTKTIIIDLGSVKEFIKADLPRDLKDHFVACHPIAGSDKDGYENSDADLFQNKKFIICQDKDSKNAKIISDLVKKIGANVEFIDAETHDEIYALVSHLPQFLSFLTKEYSPKNLENNFLKNAFRLDNSPGEIWEDIFEINEKNLEKFYLEFFDYLEKFVTLLKNYELDKLISELKINKSTSNAKINESEINKSDLDKILFRVLIVASFLKIKKIESLKTYAGTGFKDFTSMINLLELDNKFLLEGFKNNKKEILNLIQKISN